MDPASALESCYTHLVGSKTPEWRGARRASTALGPIAKSGMLFIRIVVEAGEVHYHAPVRIPTFQKVGIFCMQATRALAQGNKIQVEQRQARVP